MKEDSSNWLCPFCLTSWICDGPHIEAKDMRSFTEFMHYAKEDHAYTCLEEIKKYEIEKGLDLNSLKETVIKKVMERDR